jgi:Flp pilus assembly protein CpaB
VKKSRIRSLILPVGLAVIALVLIGVYMASYRSSVDNGAELVKVLVAARDIPAGTGGKAVASGDYLKSQTVPRRAVVPGSIVSEASLTSQVVADPIYEGQQIMLRQFAPKTQGGVFAKFSGKERAVAVLGEPHQLLAGTLTDGDHVDVVATAKYSAGGPSRATTKVVLRDLLVLEAPDVEEAGSSEDTTATLVMTDRQAQTMGWAMKMSTWFLALRPTAKPKDSKAELETLHTFLARGLPKSKASALIIGDFPESVDGS